MSEAREQVPLPTAMMDLPVNKAGYVVPWFVQWIDGEPDFRIMDAAKLNKAAHKSLCWLCGRPLVRMATFVIGPMCAVNRTSAEPPCHYPCAVYAARVCPFLTRPQMVRREHGMPTDKVAPPGVMLTRNPGVTLLWTTLQVTAYQHGGGLLFDIGEPRRTEWYCQGRAATAEEIMASVDSGLPALRKVAEAESPDAVAELDRRYQQVAAMVTEVEGSQHDNRPEPSGRSATRTEHNE
jgi:hypothetical protein